MTTISLVSASGCGERPRAAALKCGRFELLRLPRLPLAEGQLRVRPIATGICGTDLSAWANPQKFLDSLARFGATNFLFNPEEPLVLGHEFTSEVLEVADGVDEFAPGDRIFTMPVVTAGGTLKTVGYDNVYPGGLSDEVVVDNWGHIKLDPGVDPVTAALLDPIATGVEGARRSGCQEGDVALVTGVGPVGLGAVIEFVSRRAASVVVSDPSRRRRDIAVRYGASHAVDPTMHDPVALCKNLLREGARLRIVEASGAVGIVDRLMQSVPRFGVIAVMGANTEGETIYPMGATTANVTLVFASGPDFGEERYEGLYRAYDLLRDGAFDASAMVTGYTGLGGVGAAFRALRPPTGPTEHVKILILPGLEADRILRPDEFDGLVSTPRSGRF